MIVTQETSVAKLRIPPLQNSSEFKWWENVKESLFKLTIGTGIPILCYGLLTDFKTKLFPASQRLIELGAKLERLKSVDAFGEVPVINSLWIDDVLQTEGSSVQMGREEKYKTLSLKQYWKELGKWQN